MIENLGLRVWDPRPVFWRADLSAAWLPSLPGYAGSGTNSHNPSLPPGELKQKGQRLRRGRFFKRLLFLVSGPSDRNRLVPELIGGWAISSFAYIVWGSGKLALGPWPGKQESRQQSLLYTERRKNKGPAGLPGRLSLRTAFRQTLLSAHCLPNLAEFPERARTRGVRTLRVLTRNRYVVAHADERSRTFFGTVFG